MMDNRLEQRNAVKFCFLLGKTAAETVIMLRTAYKDGAMSKTQIYRMFARFKNGQLSLGGQSCSGQTDENTTNIHELNLEYRRRAIAELNDLTDASWSSCQRNLAEELEKKRVAAKLACSGSGVKKKFKRRRYNVDKLTKIPRNHGVLSQIKWLKQFSTEEEEANEKVEMVDFEDSVHTSMLSFICTPHNGKQVIQDLEESPCSSSWNGKSSNRSRESESKQMSAQRESNARGRKTRLTSNGNGYDSSDEGSFADLEENDVDESLIDEDEFHVKTEDGSLDYVVKEEVEIDERLKEEPGEIPAEYCNGKEIKEWHIEGCTIKQEIEEGLCMSEN
ncbi:uncharacterized protein LOC143034474 isoform X1 [Oratosquilla oratoria]|uniref:uncharacterized protein LOC143034474 isoform X1 n=1 Tax=Oratosquilla oratoria TaxID=337810 RepID=UPI003F76DD80